MLSGPGPAFSCLREPREIEEEGAAYVLPDTLGILGASAPNLIELAEKMDYAEALVEGWKEATRQHGDRDWARAILGEDVERNPCSLREVPIAIFMLTT